jgi:PTS system galactitol-specific IIA component
MARAKAEKEEQVLMKIEESIVALDMTAQDCTEVILELAEMLRKAGYVGSSYGEASVAREMVHPTGLPSKPICIAIPHADADDVITSALAYASLKDPVMFRNMVEPEEELPVEMVFMIANGSPEEQVKALRRLATLFGDPEKLVELKALTQTDAIVAWFKAALEQAD